MKEMFLQILNMSITASYVILAVLLMRLVLKKAPKKYSYLLWSAVAFRLCCPVSFRSFFSIFSFTPFDMSVAQQSGNSMLTYIPKDIAVTEQPYITIGIPQMNSAINEHISFVPPQSGTSLIDIIINVAMYVWLAGVLVLLVWGAVSYIRLRLRMRDAMYKQGNIYQSDKVRSPFIMGIFRPRIYIPFSLSADEEKYVLSHENYHIKRLDHIVRLFSYVLLAVYWFSPLCWLSFFLMSRDMEMSCDEKILGSGEDIRKNYSTVLLSFASNRRFPTPTPLSFGEMGVRSRIKNILKWKKPKTVMTAVAIIVCAVSLVACVSNPNLGDKTNDPSDIGNETASTSDTDEAESLEAETDGRPELYAITPEQAGEIKSGMTYAEIVALIGKPQRQWGSGVIGFEWTISDGTYLGVSFAGGVADGVHIAEEHLPPLDDIEADQ